ncbi:MAG: NADH-quinone oxidoreductase subunit J, partial [Alphaproteobacteria bacterium]|nr:NADH-quinone oxidoreductase subunit J [Alphaproteobacteria bacterium]
LLYTDYLVPFQIAGLILLVSMVSAIVLTLRVRKTAKRQNVADQLARRPEDAMEIRKVKTGEGVP